MPREKSLKLSKRHGLQPTIPVCPCCGKPKDRIMLLGASGDKLAKSLGREDGEMPMHARIPGDIELCRECLDKGVQFIEVGDGVKPTGRWWLVLEDSFRKTCTNPALLEKALEDRRVLVRKEDAEALFSKEEEAT